MRWPALSQSFVFLCELPGGAMSKRDTDIWMPLAIGAYLGKTMHLTTLHHGAYLLLLMDYWKRGPLPNDQPQLAAICKMDASSIAWANAWRLLGTFFEVREDGLLHNDRADAEIAKADANHSAAKEKASKAANAMWEKKRQKQCLTDAPSTAQAMLQNAPSPSPVNHIVLAPAALPVWLPEQEWNGFLMMREKNRRRPTERAKELIIKKLDRLRTQGHDPAAVLDQSTINGYTDVYELRGTVTNGANQRNKPQRISAAEAREQANREAAANVLRKIHGDTQMGSTGGSPEQGNTTGGGLLPVAGGPIVLPPVRH
jgi:uncharacterized protein YdaU (DUF1376 family)